MKKTVLTLLIVWATLINTGPPALAQQVSMGEAYTVAENWITVILRKSGGWGGSDSAQIDEIMEFKRKDNTVGYFCRIKPQGFIVISTRRELAPVKAYSALSDLDPEAEEGLADLLKGRMEGLLRRFQQAQAKSQAGLPGGWTEVAEIDYRQVWDALEGDVPGFMDESARPFPSPKGMKPEDLASEGELDLDIGLLNYQEGGALLTSHWHQFPPYNNFCPDMSCVNTTNNNAVVGCVATAGAQLMRYWNWPPYGEGAAIGGVTFTDSYDWINMPDTATTGSPTAVQNAVAELSYEIGLAVGMDYGCDGSSAYTYDMDGVFENRYRYETTVTVRYRDDYTADSWFDLMKGEFNFNRPVQYRIPGHSIVGDGWQEVGNPVVKQYHMVYGWTNAGNDTWYTLDSLSADPAGEEYLLEAIRPEPSITSLSGATYARDAAFPYRYFYRDTGGTGATFEGGQSIQFLPNIAVYNTSTTGGTIDFEGSDSSFSYLFTRGDRGRGIKMHLDADAAVKLYQNGMIKFH
ncbi:MAG: C10 family peptidase [Deltaproteobacteria bacterium]|nr:C10 family peptidase [Deltaproteobacteria bacterium]